MSTNEQSGGRVADGFLRLNTNLNSSHRSMRNSDIVCGDRALIAIR
jgi:hypothetical protein